MTQSRPTSVELNEFQNYREGTPLVEIEEIKDEFDKENQPRCDSEIALVSASQQSQIPNIIQLPEIRDLPLLQICEETTESCTPTIQSNQISLNNSVIASPRKNNPFGNNLKQSNNPIKKARQTFHYRLPTVIPEESGSFHSRKPSSQINVNKKVPNL